MKAQNKKAAKSHTKKYVWKNGLRFVQTKSGLWLDQIISNTIDSGFHGYTGKQTACN